MYKTLFFAALLALGLGACKPTPRTAGRKHQQQQEQKEQLPDVPQPEHPAELLPPPAQPTPQHPSQQQPEQAAISPESVLLTVMVTRQPYNKLTPWEKLPATQRRMVGTYLGNGLVLTHGQALENTTYAELSLPNATRTVPAKVLRYDEDLALGLLTITHESDADIFDTRRATTPGAPLQRGEKAELLCTINGTEPLSVPLRAQAGTTAGNGMPRMELQAEIAVPELFSYGAPVIKDGKLAGLSAGYESTGRKLTIINAEIINRFLQQTEDTPTGVPSIGVELATLDDPVFRRYLKLREGQTGIYISKVKPGSAAEAAQLREGDVITAIEGMSIDNLGRCDLPIYGLTDSAVAVRYLKPLGQELNLTISREGESKDVTVALNTDARDKALLATEKTEAAPRYIVWGGLVFQPLTETYRRTLKTQARGTLPVEFLELDDREEELRGRGYRELTAITLVIPTPTTLGYDSLGFCVVEKVNGREPHDFAEFAAMLDEPTPDGTVELTINKAPYRIYLDRSSAEATNDALRRGPINSLRRME